ncbi:alkaline phosphatase [Hydrogenophaga sp.]|uniref:alkaline phosphatase D family protein n=1 Tax=Hydrogenophaga sp. TaxID=1904254 RepID=UPI00271DA655|nr:alkaline phosphatase D family protein [Hydrogenophaga sp.]MDO9435613.1 alkaline phosphatase D family protein [Hydrogenophaga sp.]
MTLPSNRRDLLRLAATSALATSLPRWAWSQTLRQRDLFPLGVASGAPSADGFVLWTRLLAGPVPGTASAGNDAPPLNGPVTVQWQVADDEAFTRTVRSGEATAHPALGHSVHVEIKGLRPDRWYFYRFMHGDAVTPVARTRTVPAADALVAHMRVAYASCQRWEQGHYAGYRHMANDNPDLVLFLGDYIYEYAMPAKAPGTPLVRTHTLQVAENLQDFRDRYALYKTDQHLQAMHRACPWLVSWDDHEVQNDYAGLIGTGVSEATFQQRRQAGYQAFYENMPLRAGALVRGVQGLASNSAVRVHTRTSYGRLATFHMLDTRQFRDLEPCRVAGERAGGALSNQTCPARADPSRSMLGTAQEQWLDQGLAQDSADGRTRWSVLAQQTLFSQRIVKAAPQNSFSPNTWDGYPAARQRVLDALQARSPRNAVFLGGDIHQNVVCQVHADVARPDSPVIASEFCGTSLSSASGVPQSSMDAIRARNPHILLARSDRRGYVVADISPTEWTTHLRVLDDVSREDSGVSTLARFMTSDGRPGTERVG